MNIKLLLISFLLLKGCSIYEPAPQGYPYSGWSYIVIMNNTPTNKFVWHELIYGNDNREISDVFYLRAHGTTPFPLGNYESILGWMYAEDPEKRLDSIYLYISSSKENYELWNNQKSLDNKDDRLLYDVQYLITKDNLLSYMTRNDANSLYIQYDGVLR